MHVTRSVPLALLSLVIASACLDARQGPDPEPPTPGLGKLTRYLFEDTESVLVVNVKRLVGSQLYRKHLEKPGKQFLDQPPIRTFFKAVEVDLPRDVDQIAVVMGRNTWAS